MNVGRHGASCRKRGAACRLLSVPTPPRLARRGSQPPFPSPAFRKCGALPHQVSDWLQVRLNQISTGGRVKSRWLCAPATTITERTCSRRPAAPAAPAFGAFAPRPRLSSATRSPSSVISTPRASAVPDRPDGPVGAIVAIAPDYATLMIGGHCSASPSAASGRCQRPR